MDVQEVFADNMRDLRACAGLSQKMLAKRSGLNRSYIGGIERKSRNPSLKNVGRIAEALDVDPAMMLIGGRQARAEAEDAMGKALDELQDEAPRLAPGGYALLAMGEEGELQLEPIRVRDEDLTLRILCILVDEGYDGSLEELAEAYDRVAEPVLAFARSFRERELVRKQKRFAEEHGIPLDDFGDTVGCSAACADDALAPPDPFA